MRHTVLIQRNFSVIFSGHISMHEQWNGQIIRGLLINGRLKAKLSPENTYIYN